MNESIRKTGGSAAGAATGSCWGSAAGACWDLLGDRVSRIRDRRVGPLGRVTCKLEQRFRRGIQVQLTGRASRYQRQFDGTRRVPRESSVTGSFGGGQYPPALRDDN